MNLNPLFLSFFDSFQHSPYKNIRHQKRTSVNVLYTLISHDERLSAYNASTEMIPNPLENNITERCSDKIVKDFVEKLLSPRVIYECSKLSVHGTEYKRGQYVILPESSNTLPVFGKIFKLLSCEKFGYLIVQKTSSKFCQNTDLYYLTETQEFKMVPCMQLPSFHTLEAYLVGEAKKVSISLRNYILEHLD